MSFNSIDASPFSWGYATAFRSKRTMIPIIPNFHTIAFGKILLRAMQFAVFF
jgi:hypothetical protein